MQACKEKSYSSDRIAYEMYKNIVIKDSDKVSKAIIARCLSNILLDKFYEEPDNTKEQILTDPHLDYLVNAIKYAAGISEVNASCMKLLIRKLIGLKIYSFLKEQVSTNKEEKL